MLRILCVMLLTAVLPVHATTLLVFGDSLSAGYQLPVQQSWPALLQQYWQQQHPDLQLINASVSGETTQGGAQRLPSLLTQHKPDWVLIELGANDGLRGLPPTSTRTNLQQMIAACQASGARMILTQIRLPPNYGRRYLQLFEPLFGQLASEHQIPLLPFFMEAVIPHPELLLPDGLHPNAAGQRRILEQVREPLTRWLSPQAKPAAANGV